MKNLLTKAFGWLFKKEETVKAFNPTSEIPEVTDEEAYIPFRSKTLDDYLISKKVDLSDPLAASVRIRKFFKATPDTKKLNGDVNSKTNILVKAASNVVIANLKNLKLKECYLTFSSDIPNTIVIINVAGSLDFTRYGKLRVAGTIKPDDVLINCTGPFGPTIMSNSSLVGTVITMSMLSVLRECYFEGETIGSSTIVSNGTMVNKTTENKAKLQKEREAALKELQN